MSATSCASVLRISVATARCNPEQASAAAGLHSHLHRLFSSASLNLCQPCVANDV
jgi:hypothetical protein